MATHKIAPIKFLPDASGNVYQEAAAANFQVNDRYPELLWRFADTATRDKLGVTFQVPQNYVGNPKIGIIWGTTATTGDARLEFDYTAIADGESGDPSADQESVAATVTVPSTARLYKVTEIALTAANIAAADIIQGALARDGAEAGPLDTLAASLYVMAVYLSYTDA